MDDFAQTPFRDDFADAPFSGTEFAENAEPRCACVLVLDCSGSMKGDAIVELNRGLELFAAELREDRLTAKRVDISVVAFGDQVDVIAEFGSAQNFHPLPLVAKGSTPMGEALNVAMDLTAARQTEYRTNGITPYRAMIFMITDGAPTDQWERAAKRVHAGEERKSFMFFAVGVAGADTSVLSQISVRAPVMLRGLAFSDMFRWLSSSLASVSRSSVGQEVLLANPAGPNGWASIV